MPPSPRDLLLGALLALPACRSTPAPAPGDDVPRLCRALVAAQPEAWTPALAALHPHGARAAAPLAAELERHPDAPGAQAAVALLGRLGDPAAAPFLHDLVADRGPLAAEAALALGYLRDRTAREALVRCAADPLADATLRTAAACAAVRLGEGPRVARLLHAVMVASTPAGQELVAATRLPDKPRWAYERYLIQRLLLDCCPDDPGFDTDAPWSELDAAGARIARWLETR